MLPFCLPVSFLLAYFSFWESQVWNPTWYFFFFFLSLRFSSSCFLHMAAQNGGIERPAATRYITLRNTLPAHHLISCFQCGSEAATPPDPLYSHHVRNSHFSHCLWLAPNYLAPQTPGPLWSPAMLRIKKPCLTLVTVKYCKNVLFFLKQCGPRKRLDILVVIVT